MFVQDAGVRLENAQLAHEFGVRYFASLLVSNIIPITNTMKNVRWHVDRDGGSPKRLTQRPGLDCEPVWSPDGRHIAFESDRGGDKDIYVMDFDEKNQRSISKMMGNERGPAWSPDGREIAFSTTVQRLRVAPVDGAGSRRVAHVLYDISSICWSPDGRYIAAAFRGPRERSSSGFLIVRSDGKKRKNVVLAQAVRPYPSTIRQPNPT